MNKLFSFYKNLNIAVKASIWFTVCSILQKGISVITLPIFTRLMSTEQYGQYSIYLSWYNIIVIFVTLNIQSEIANKGFIEHFDKKNEYLSNQILLAIILFFVWLNIYLISKPILNKLMGVTLPLMLAIMIEILGNAIITLWTVRKRFDYEYKKIVLCTLLISILNPIISAIAVIISTNKAEARMFSGAIIPALFGLFLALYYTFSIKRVNIQWWKSTIISAIPLIPHYLSLVVLSQADRLMIDHFLGPSEAGLYSVAYSTGLIMTIVNGSINSSFVPWEYERLKLHESNSIRQTANTLMLIVVFVNASLIIVAPECIKILAAPQYLEAVWCVVPLAISVYFYFVYTLFVNVEIYYGANHFVAIASVVAALLNIILNYIFIPMYGYIASAYTTLSSYFFTMILHYIFMQAVLKKNEIKIHIYDIKYIVLISIGLAFSAMFGMLLYPHPLVRWIIISFGLIIILIKKHSLISILRKIKKR